MTKKDDKPRLTEIEKKELSIRKSLIDSKQLELRIMKNEQAVFTESLIRSKGLDPKKKFSIEADGVLVEETETNTK